jgi:hypothetical protein
MAFEAVYAVAYSSDGPRRGIADYGGRPHLFECQWDDVAGTYCDTYWLMPLDEAVVARACEQLSRWQRWEEVYASDWKTSRKALDASEELREFQRFAQEHLVIRPGQEIRCGGEFRTASPASEAERLEVRWSDCSPLDTPRVGMEQ